MRQLGLIKPTTQLEIITELEQLSEQLQPDVSRYAKGRLRLWLNCEPSLAKQPTFKQAVEHQRLWTYIQRVYPAADCALVSYGPNGIALHRDASYADNLAVSINLGGCTWQYDHHRGGGQLEDFQLKGGEVFSFDCKHLHAATDCSSDRWSVNIWKIKDCWK